MIFRFGQVKFSEDAITAEDCYLELAEKVRESLGPIDPYFEKLADAMIKWIECWKICQA